MGDGELPRDWFRRMDEAPDADFYVEPRFVTHIDDSTVAALTQFYRETIPAGADVLDLMSSWVSHLPDEGAYGNVAGLGMNAAELDRNPRLTERLVHDLNTDPVLPWPDATFDAVLNAVSIQYLTRPIEVFAEVARVLRPGGLSIVSMSHRCFPTKAVAAFQAFGPAERVGIVMEYHRRAGGFASAALIDRSPPDADPLWIVQARRE